MTENDLLDRITSKPDIFGGKPIIKGFRVAVSHLLEMLEEGTRKEILEGYPFLSEEDIDACELWAKTKGKGATS